MDKQQVLQRTQLIALTGSRAYKIHNPDSDSDYKGICIGLPAHYYGFSKFEQMDKGWEGTEAPFDYLGRDTVIFEIRKFFNLAFDNNPNILDMLYSPDYKLLTPIGEKLLENRDIFISKRCMKTFSGYAYAQARKIESHRKWLLSPPKTPPTLEQFGLTEQTILSKTELHSFLEYLYQLMRDKIEYIEEKGLVEEGLIKTLQADIDFKQIVTVQGLPEETLQKVKDLTGATDNYIEKLQKTHSYNTAKKHWDSYQEWKKHRNRERAVLESKIGYDSKHGGHLIRLMRMGCEILEGKGILVDREVAGDAEEIRNIRNGNVPYEQLMEEFNKLNAKLEVLYKESTIPYGPPKEKIENLCIELVEHAFHKGL
jgi:predicted nucleotidyltransferase